LRPSRPPARSPAQARAEPPPARRSPSPSQTPGPTGPPYLTKAGLSYRYPGRLSTGDQIFSNDVLVDGKKKIGFGNEVCTVTFDGNDFCRTIVVFPGKGDLDATWLWVGRNKSEFGPRRFTGVIDGGTGAYANATGEFEATANHDGTVEYTATLG
jgi:hypothetical protein